MNKYKKLDPNSIIRTLSRLEERILARFPGSGLASVCRELIEIARETEARIAVIAKPHLLLRLAIVSILFVGVFLLAKVGSIIEVKRDTENLYGVLQGIDAAFNTLVVMGAGILFLASLESRWKRHKALEHLHEIRSIIHIIDMHQLPKDPSASHPATVSTTDASDVERPITAFELSRYLDYCSEMLSLSSKVAALYAQSTKDSIVIDAASDLNQITSNLSSKIWQKITIAQSMVPQPSALPTPQSPPPLPTSKPALS